MAYDQDMDRVEAVMEEYDVKTQVYPMVRVNSVRGNSSLEDERMVSMEQGQYIGISEDTYRALKEALGKTPENLELKDGEIHTVLPAKYIHAGQKSGLQQFQNGNYLPVRTALLYYSVDRRHEIYTGHEEVGRERDILTGVLGEGEQEHLVVFSDEEFERGYESVRKKNEENMPVLLEQGEAAWEEYMVQNEDNLTDGPTNLILWEVPQDQYEDVVSALSFLEDEHPIDRLFDERVGNLYPKDEMIGKVKESNVRDLTTQAVAAALVFVFGLFQIYSKT